MNFPNYQKQWMGQYADGRSAALRSVSVRIGHGEVLVYDESGSSPVATFRNITVEVISDGQSRLTDGRFPDAELIVRGPMFSDALMVAGYLKRPMKRGPLLLFLSLGLLAAAVLIFSAVEPLSKILAGYVPVSIEQKLQNRMLAFFSEKKCIHPSAESAIAALVGKLNGGDKSVPNVIIVDDKLVNAFALPGGIILLNRGLIERADDSDEVAGVLAHEMEHLARRHVLARLIRSLILTGIWQATVGDFSGLLAVDPATAIELAGVKFDRDAESEADEGALRRLSEAGIATKGFASFFGKLESKEPEFLAFLSTHPPSAQRRARSEAASANESTRPALNEEQWSALRAACQGRVE